MAKPLKQLCKSDSDKRLAGICGGFGEFTPMPSWLWRAIFVASIFIGGMGVVTYIILWIFMPNASTQRSEKEIEGETIRKTM